MNPQYEAQQRAYEEASAIELAAWKAWDTNPLDPINRLNYEAASEHRKYLLSVHSRQTIES